MAEKVLIAGQWRDARSTGSFQVADPRTSELLTAEYPVSQWDDCEEAIAAAAAAHEEMLTLPTSASADFLDCFADRIEARRDEIVQIAENETGLPASPRLNDVELPRTTGQLRQAASATRHGAWAMPTIDTAANIRSVLASIGPVAVFGPNNFPLAFNSVSGGDFAAAIAAGNPVIGKANSSHPGTTKALAEEALAAAQQTGVPNSIVQMVYRTSHADGERLVADPRMGAIGYTGSRGAGLKLKQAADAAGNSIYLELSSVNPVVILPGALSERFGQIVDDFSGSCLLGTGQFCTNPGLIILLADEATDRFLQSVSDKFAAAPVGTLLSQAVSRSLEESITALMSVGAERLVGDQMPQRAGFCHANTLLKASASQFLADPEAFQIEAFGNASLCVVAENVAQLGQVLHCLEGNLTGCIYTASGADDDPAYRVLAPILRRKVGRLLNDKMPTGVAVSAAMNHGGPYPATGHPGFTAVGIPASIRRFAMLQCFDGVRHDRLPDCLQDKNPDQAMWRLVDGCWTCDDIQQ